MESMMETIFGSLIIAIPLLLVGLFLFWSNYRPVFWMLAGALVVGLGYLGVVGSTAELGKPIVNAIYGTEGTMGERAMDAAKETMKKAKEKAAVAKEAIKKKAAEAKEAIKKKAAAAKAAIKKKMEASTNADDTATAPSNDTGSGTPGDASGSTSSPPGRYVTP